jgi:protein involved in temperature-dependent protein secretion
MKTQCKKNTRLYGHGCVKWREQAFAGQHTPTALGAHGTSRIRSAKRQLRAEADISVGSA